jgi:hypothetical protein
MLVLSSPLLSIFSLTLSHHLSHEITHFFCGILLHLARDVGVGAERKACVEVF